MAKEKEQLKPVTVKSVPMTRQIDVPAGHSLIVPIVDGKELEDQAFVIANRTADKIYANNPAFAVKKKL